MRLTDTDHQPKVPEGFPGGTPEHISGSAKSQSIQRNGMLIRTNRVEPLGIEKATAIALFSIGSHADYDKMLS
jgi:hypothetical protein